MIASVSATCALLRARRSVPNARVCGLHRQQQHQGDARHSTMLQAVAIRRESRGAFPPSSAPGLAMWRPSSSSASRLDEARRRWHRGDRQARRRLHRDAWRYRRSRGRAMWRRNMCSGQASSPRNAPSPISGCRPNVGKRRPRGSSYDGRQYVRQADPARHPASSARLPRLRGGEHLCQARAAAEIGKRWCRCAEGLSGPEVESRRTETDDLLGQSAHQGQYRRRPHHDRGKGARQSREDRARCKFIEILEPAQTHKSEEPASLWTSASSAAADEPDGGRRLRRAPDRQGNIIGLIMVIKISGQSQTVRTMPNISLGHVTGV